ncbi:uncharacterized protein LOC116733898 isoform X2 [Xiphophorus hellerii]|uniref:uncharacterized protein LOC116733898 isoform X2 n=1 Tax=Xiphophorus hellerii TaxID=8084 RepID=UPI0013B46E04|nr:uncharacterized protein LOC116733898 isoform X2 [Xiphophorus hellerii]
MATASQPERSHSRSPASQKKSIKYEKLSLALLNINGLRNKTHEIRHIIAHDKLHVVALCETKLNSTVKESDVYIPGFTMWRRDRNDNSDNKGGGVALYVQDHIKTTLRPDLMKAEADKKNHKAEEENPEAIIWVEMEFPGSRPVLLGCCYRPTKDKTKYFEQINETITLMSEKEKGKDIFLMGDFNIDWLSNSEKEKADEYIKEQSWTQIVKAATRVTLDSATCIDHIYTNIKDRLEPKNIPTGCSDHNLITVKINRKIPERERNFRSISKEFKKETFQKEIKNVKWGKVCKLTTRNESLQEALNMFTKEFLKVADEHTKLSNKNIYMLLKLVDLENILSERDKKKKKAINMIFKFIEIKKQAEVEMDNYLKSKKGKGENDATKNNNKKTSHKGNNTSQGAAAKEGDDPKQIHQTNPKNTDLESGFKGFLVQQQYKTKSKTSIFEITDIKAIKTCLKNVCDHVVKVIDENEAELWELAAGSISAPIRDILNGYIKIGEIPDELKKIKSFPFSTDNYSDIRQSRGADRLHIILSYIFDVILYEQAKPYFIEDENKQTKSIATLQGNLEQLKTDWLSLGEKNRAVEAVFLDFTSSFDKISHDLLITKLEGSGFSESDLKLIKSFLSIQEGSSGLPRISCLSQLLHIIIINDLKKNLEPSAVICNNYMMICARGDPKMIESELNQKMKTVRTRATEFSILFKDTRKQFNILFKVRRKQFKLSELSAMFKILESMIRCHGDESNWIRAPGNIVKQNGDWKYDNISKELELHFGKEYKVEPENVNNSLQKSQTKNQKRPAGPAGSTSGSGGSSLSQRKVRNKTKK